MKARFTVGWCLATVLVMSSHVARTQVPYFQAYFDYSSATDQGNPYLRECRAAGIYDTLAVVVHGVNRWIDEAQFRLDLPPALLYLDFLATATLTIGSPPSGLALAWQQPQPVFGPFVVARVIVVWTMSCDCGYYQPIRIYGFPPDPNPQLVRWPDYVAFDAVGLTSYICPNDPAVWSRTWGAVKALYRQAPGAFE